MILIISIFVIASTILIFIGIFGTPTMNPKRVQLPKAEGEVKRKKIGAYILITIPFSKKLLEKLKLHEKMKNDLDAAHVNLTPAQFISLKIIFMVIAGVGCILALGTPEPLYIFIAISLGYLLPEIWLKKKVKQRRYEIARVLPETIDLLGLCVEAGLDFTTSVRWILEKKVTTNPMIEELAIVLEEIKWGKPRSQALKDMAKRLDIPEVSSFVHAMVQAERMGTPVSETFGILSEDTRLQRFRRGERIALQAPIKILLPLIFCILPVIAIIVGGPILLQFMQGGTFSNLGH